MTRTYSLSTVAPRLSAAHKAAKGNAHPIAYVTAESRTGVLYVVCSDGYMVDSGVLA